MTDLTTRLRDVSEKAGKATPRCYVTKNPCGTDTVMRGRACPAQDGVCRNKAACPPALIQALVEVVMAASDHYACHPDNTTHALIEALHRLEAVAQHLES